MGRAIIAAIGRLENYVCASSKRMDAILSPSAVAGTRAAPTQAGTNDTKIGVRMDFGEITEHNGQKVRQVKIQPNKGADNPTLKAKAQKNPHQVSAVTYLPDDGKLPVPTVSKNMFADLSKSADDEEDDGPAKKTPKKGGKK